MKPRAPWAQLPACTLLTTGDVARVLRCRARTVQRLAAAGDLAGEETWSGQWLFRKRDVEAFQRAEGGRLVPTVPTATPTQLGLRWARVTGTRLE